MTAIATPPTVRLVPLVGRLPDGRPYSIPGSSMILGVPGGPPGEQGIVLVRPTEGKEPREIYAVETSGEPYLRSWSAEKHFLNSPRFPAGLEIGQINNYVDTGVGQPFIEKSDLQVSPDTYERLRAYAYEEPYVSMTERRRHAKVSERKINEQGRKIVQLTTVAPEHPLQGTADDRLDARIDALVEKRVAAALAAAERAKHPESPAK